ncbi:MAG TPA: serine hydrolase domain-containing protein [Rhizobiaceae bacterium]|nr:serine hydrolase domain-containing protein [Rhizobiaceae bacterium]
MSSDRLGRVASWMRLQTETGRLAGIEVLITRHGRPAFHHWEGMADIARGRPATPETLYRLYSMNKSLASAAAMMLYEEGHFQLDDPISRFIPAFSGQRVWSGGGFGSVQSEPALRDITFHDLLTHTSGLTYGFMQANPVDAMYREQNIDRLGVDMTLATFAEKIAKLPLVAQPGTRWNYSVSTDVLCRLIEVISGQPYDAFLTERLLTPLGMADTTFNVPAGKIDRFAACYMPDPDGSLKLQDDPETSHFTRPLEIPYGSALVSTAGDYMRFCQFLLDKGACGGTRLLGRKTVELMMMNHLRGDLAAMGQPRFAESTFHGIGFGLGFSVLIDPTRAQIVGSPGECGWGGMASTLFWVDPAEDLAVVMMTQLIPSSTYPLRRELRVLTYQAIVD